MNSKLTKLLLDKLLIIPQHYRIICALASLYFSGALTLTFVADIHFIWIITPIFFGVYFLLLLEWFDTQKEISISQQGESHKPLYIWLLCFSIIMAGQFLYWFAYYPGGFNLDALNQWEQVHGAPLNNWHPVTVTLLYRFICHFNDSLAACILVQLIAFSAAIAFLLTEIHKEKIRESLIIISAILIALNPAIGLTNICLYKDVPFSIVLILIYVHLIEICRTSGRVLQSHFFVIGFSILSLVLLLTRHNSILVLLGIYTGILVYYRKYRKQILCAVAGILMTFGLISGPIFALLHVIPHENPIGEIVGLPMSIMANALVNDPTHIPKKAADYLHAIQPDDSVWKKQYIPGWWDSVKWTITGDSEDEGGMLLQNADPIEIIFLASDTSLHCPQTTYQSIREETRVAWQIVGACNWFPYVYIETNDMGIQPQYNPTASKIVRKLFDISSESFLRIYIWNINLGFCIWMLLYLRCKKHKEGGKGILLLPALFYNLVTACLLCSPNYRYFYFNAILFLPVSFFLYQTPNEVPRNQMID